MYIKDIELSAALHYIKDSDNLTLVKSEFLHDNVSALVVINQTDDICGMITVRDLLKVSAESFHKINAGDICSNKLLSVSDQDTIHKASILMINKHCHHLLVTDDKGQTLGILSSIDIVKYFTLQHTD